jgi:hypothetical protein
LRRWVPVADLSFHALRRGLVAEIFKIELQLFIFPFLVENYLNTE